MKILQRLVLCLIPPLIAAGFPALARAQTEISLRSLQVQRLANWLFEHRGAESGLPFSHVGDPRFKDWCFTYDAAVASLAFIALGQPGEAKRIIDFYILTPYTHRLGGVVESVLAVPPYGVKDWSVRTGANLWLGLAAYHLFMSTKDGKYLSFAAQIADFALELQDRDKASTTWGGMKLGPPGKASAEGDQHFDYDPKLPGFEQIFATEATIDAFALFDQVQSEPGLARFRNARDLCLHWLRKVGWNPDQHRFNRGFYRQPDLAVATDTHAWGISALGVARLDTIEPNAAEQIVRFVEAHCQSTVAYRTPSGRTAIVTGFDFVDHAALARLKRSPLVSPEWTFQMANAYLRLADDLGAAGETGKASRYTKKRNYLLDQMITMATTRNDASGLPYASLGGVPVGHEYNTPAQGSFSTIGVAYGILALTGYDPLRPPAKR